MNRSVMGWIVYGIVAFGISVLAGEPRQSIFSDATVEGVVTIQGAPVQDVRVIFTPESYEPTDREISLNRPRGGAARNQPIVFPNSFQFVTDGSGAFVANKLPGGRYVVTLLKEGYFKSRDGGPSVLTVLPGERIENLGYELEAAGVVTGRVLDQSGNPRNGVTVSASRIVYRSRDLRFDNRPALEDKMNVRTDENGEYRLYALAPAEYYVSVIPDSALTAEYYPGAVDPADAVPVGVRSGSEVAGIDFRLKQQEMFRVRFKLDIPDTLDLDFANSRNLQITLVKRSRTMASLARAWQPKNLGENVWEFEDVPRGSYSIVYMAILGANAWHIPVEVTDRDMDAGVLSVRTGRPLEGRLLNLEVLPVGFDLANVVLDFRRMDPVLQSNVSTSRIGLQFPVQKDGTIPQRRPRGAFQDSYLLVPGKYELRLMGLPPDVYLQGATFDGQGLRNNVLDYSDRLGKLELSLGGPGGRIEGVVLNPQDRPVSGSQVVLVPDADRRIAVGLFKDGVTDQHGRFSLTGIAPGAYRLLAWEDIEPGIWLDPSFLEKYENLGQRIIITPGLVMQTTAKIISVE